MYVRNFVKFGKIMFQMLAEKLLKIGCASKDNWPELTRNARIDRSGMANLR